jgi:hypothetical protein
MREFLQTWFRRPSPARRTPARRPHKASLAVDPLEGRQLLAAAPLTFNMDFHPHGNNGLSDIVLAMRNGGNLEITVNGTRAQAVPLSSVSSLTLLGSGDVDQVVVDGSLALPASVNGRGGADSLAVFGTAGADTISMSTFVKVNGKQINFTDVSALTVRGLGGNDAISLGGTVTGVTTSATGDEGNDTFTLQVLGENFHSDGGSGADTLVNAAVQSSVFEVTGVNQGSLKVAGDLGTTFTLVENLTGSSVSDTFKFFDGGSVSGTVDGAGGEDRLDYFARTTAGVGVDLKLQVATGAGSVRGVEGVHGTKFNDFIRGDDFANTLSGRGGNDILVGLGGNDRLEASGFLRSLMIGGLGVDTLIGGDGEDIVIADHTSFDRDNAALLAIHTEWRRPDLSYSQRVQRINAGFTAPDGRLLKLNTQTVGNQSGVDILTGKGGLDWFWSFSDKVVDRAAGEKVN